MAVEEHRYVVWVPGPAEWPLPPAYPLPCRFGGHRTMHELAVAIAATGRPVEMRGGVDEDELNAIAGAVGARPALPSESRRPVSGDVVLLSEGQSAISVAQIALSPARLIMLLLAPPGLLGWPFVEAWSLPSLLDVDLEAVALPEHFQAMAAMGFELWAQAPAMLERIQAAGVPGHFVGVGRPAPFPAPEPKRYDVVTLGDNRWTEAARAVAARLNGSVVHHEIPRSPHDALMRELGRARIFVHPLRLEGGSRVGWEARGMGAVPVVLNTSPFSVGLDEAGGALAVGSVDEMPEAVLALLGDPERLERLRQRAMTSAREQVDWDAFVARVDEGLCQPPPVDPARPARAGMGKALADRESELKRELGAQISELRGYAKSLEREVEALQASREDLAAYRDLLLSRIEEVQRTLAWRLATRYRQARNRLAGGRNRRPASS